MPTFIFDENLLEKAIFIFVGSGFAAGLCFSILGDIWEGVNEWVVDVWDSALEAFGGCDIADLEEGTFLQEIAKALKKILASINQLLDSRVWYFHIGPSLVLGLGGLVFPIYKVVREFLSIARWPDFVGFDLYEVLAALVNHAWTNLPVWVKGSLHYLLFLYVCFGVLIWFLEFSFFFTLLAIRPKKKASAGFKSFLRKKLKRFLN